MVRSHPNLHMSVNKRGSLVVWPLHQIGLREKLNKTLNIFFNEDRKGEKIIQLADFDEKTKLRTTTLSIMMK